MSQQAHQQSYFKLLEKQNTHITPETGTPHPKSFQ